MERGDDNLRISAVAQQPLRGFHEYQMPLFGPQIGDDCDGRPAGLGFVRVLGESGQSIEARNVDAELAEPWLEDYLESYSETIAGGTAEIQRNIIGERLLGLPRQPRP